MGCRDQPKVGEMEVGHPGRVDHAGRPAYGCSPIVEITMQGALEGAEEKRFGHLWKGAASFPRKPSPSSNGSNPLYPGSE